MTSQLSAHGAPHAAGHHPPRARRCSAKAVVALEGATAALPAPQAVRHTPQAGDACPQLLHPAASRQPPPHHGSLCTQPLQLSALQPLELPPEELCAALEEQLGQEQACMLAQTQAQQQGVSRRGVAVQSTRTKRAADTQQPGRSRAAAFHQLQRGAGAGEAAHLAPQQHPEPEHLLLLPAEEFRLAAAVQRGRRIERAAAAYAAQHGRPPTAAQLAAAAGVGGGGPEVEAVLRRGWAARQLLVDRNRPLVAHMAGRLRGLGLSMEDLVGEGLAALEQAAGSFQPDHQSRGTRFSSYAGTAIFRNMLRAVHNHGRVVRLPTRLHQTMMQVNKARRALQSDLQREPSCAEVAAAVGLQPHEVRELQAAFKQPGSLVQEPGDSGRGGQLEVQAEEVVDADCADWAANDLLAACLVLDVAAALRALKPTHRQAVELRHGLLDCTPRTWREVGEQMQLTHQRAQQLHQAAIREMRKHLAG